MNNTGNLLFEFSEVLTQPVEKVKESTPSFNNERCKTVQQQKVSISRPKAIKIARNVSTNLNSILDNVILDSESFVSHNSSVNRHSDSRDRSQEFRINSSAKKPSCFGLSKLKSQETNELPQNHFNSRMRSYSLETQTKQSQQPPINVPSKFRISRDSSLSGNKVFPAPRKVSVESRHK